MLVSEYWAGSTLCWLHTQRSSPHLIIFFFANLNISLQVIFHNRLTVWQRLATPGQKWHLGPRWDYHFPGAPLALPAPMYCMLPPPNYTHTHHPHPLCPSPRSVDNCHSCAKPANFRHIDTEGHYSGHRGDGCGCILRKDLLAELISSDLVVHLFCRTDWFRGSEGLIPWSRH